MGKKYYSIGEIAKLLSITETTLRHYDKINLIKPAYIDPNTGYRYYIFAQFYQIHRIKYLQHLGLSLEEIQKTLSGKNGRDALLFFLENKKQEHRKAIKDLKTKINDIDWSIGYYTYMDENIVHDLKIKTLEERYMLFVSWDTDDTIDSSEIKLSKLRNQSEFSNIKVRRQWGYLLDYKSFTQNDFSPILSTMYIDEKVPINPDCICTASAGEYLCFNACLMENDFGNIKYINQYLKDLGISPKVMYAWEYDAKEIYQKEYTTAIYELQILIS